MVFEKELVNWSGQTAITTTAPSRTVCGTAMDSSWSRVDCGSMTENGNCRKKTVIYSSSADFINVKCRVSDCDLNTCTGKGMEKFANGDVYMGQYSNDQFHGQGELKTRGGKYKGMFANGLKHGKGLMQFRTNSRYDGEWFEGRMSGRGVYIWPDNRKYEGQWVKGERHGEGSMTMPNSEKYGMFLVCNFLWCHFARFTSAVGRCCRG